MESDAGRRARGLAYLQHLTGDDRALLARFGGADGAAVAGEGRGDPGRVEGLLASPRLHRAVFPDDATDDALLRVSPFLLFAVAVTRAWRDLHELAYVHEWTGARERLPVFVDDELRGLLDDPEVRLFLTELLASYTHVASGAIWVRTRRGPRRRRFSELDISRLATLVEVVPENAHAGVYRRLGDLALFLTGVFPDHTARRTFAPIEMERLARALRGTDTGPGADQLAEAMAIRGTVGLLEQLGARWYRLAADALHEQTPTVTVVTAVAARFADARRVLNHATDRYLLTHRARWFPSTP